MAASEKGMNKRIILIATILLASCSTEQPRDPERDARRAKMYAELNQKQADLDAEVANKKKLAEEDKIKSKEEERLRKIQDHKDFQERKARENADGTSVLNDYCLSQQIIRRTTAEIEHERSIAKEVGMVDKQKLYESGETLVDAKKNLKQQEVAYYKQTGKKPNTTMCASTPYP